jgi:transcriptional antiterminator NusG
MLIATFSCILSDLTHLKKNAKINYEVIIMYSNWYVIQVQPKSEYRLCTKIKDRISKDLYRDCFVPQAEYLYKKDGVFEKRIRPLFPGYIFVSTDNVRDFYDSLKKIDGFKRILKSGEDFTPISSEEAGFIAGITDDDYNISLSAGFIIDSKITITSGPLIGNEGIIKKIDRHKRIGLIELNFMGQPQLVKMPLEIISKS